MGLIQCLITDTFQALVSKINSNNNWLSSSMMKISDYVKSIGSINTNKVDHAAYTDMAGSAAAGGPLALQISNLQTFTTLAESSFANGWTFFNSTTFPISKVYKDAQNLVHYEIPPLKGGTTAGGTELFNLPTGFRPEGQIMRWAKSFASGASPQNVAIYIAPDGSIKIGYEGTANSYILCLDIEPYLATQ